MSRTSRIDGRGGKTNSFCAWYSFRMSFCSVPPSRARATPAFSAWATYMAKITAAGELIVIDVVIVAEVDAGVEVLHVGQACRRRRRTGRPRRATSGRRSRGPSSVGMSNAVDSPSPPARMISLNRQLVSSAVPKPANIRIVHSFERYIDAYGPTGVRVLRRGTRRRPGPYTGSSGTPDIVVKSASRDRDSANACSQISRFVGIPEVYLEVKAFS